MAFTGQAYLLATVAVVSAMALVCVATFYRPSTQSDDYKRDSERSNNFRSPNGFHEDRPNDFHEDRPNDFLVETRSDFQEGRSDSSTSTYLLQSIDSIEEQGKSDSESDMRSPGASLFLSRVSSVGAESASPYRHRVMGEQERPNHRRLFTDKGRSEQDESRHLGLEDELIKRGGGAEETWPDPDDPPVWTETFRARFHEILVTNTSVVHNKGMWYYHYPTKTARFDHLEGQNNNFCQGQGLSPNDPHATCHLLFTGSEDMWVIYPAARNCCHLCGATEGCTILKPDWLDNSTLVATEDIGGRECAGWAKQGAVAAADTWYQDRRGVPCRYHEVVFGVLHNLTFVPESFSTRPIEPGIFSVPDYCQDKCPNPFH